MDRPCDLEDYYRLWRTTEICERIVDLEFSTPRESSVSRNNTEPRSESNDETQSKAEDVDRTRMPHTS